MRSYLPGLLPFDKHALVSEEWGRAHMIHGAAHVRLQDRTSGPEKNREENLLNFQHQNVQNIVTFITQSLVS